MENLTIIDIDSWKTNFEMMHVLKKVISYSYRLYKENLIVQKLR